MSCIFCKIASGQAAADKLYEDELVVAFRDLNPQAPVHCLVIPRTHVVSVADLTGEHDEALCRCFEVIRTLAGELGLDDGFRVVANTGANGGQTVSHLHFHLLGGRAMTWPPG